MLSFPARADNGPQAAPPAQAGLLADYGIYTAEPGPAANTATRIALQKKTYRIPNSPGLLFGIRFVLSPKGLDTPPKARLVTVRITHPALDGPQEAQQTYTHERSLLPGELYFEGQRIPAAPGFAPGAYTFEVLLADTVLLSRSFELFQPQDTPADAEE